jgi:hypothetical protein
LEILRDYTDQFFGDHITESIGTFSLKVGPARSIPSLQPISVAFMIALILFGGVIRLHARHGSSLFLMAVFLYSPENASAQSRQIAVLLNAEPGTPSAEEVIEFATTSPAPPGPGPLATISNFPHREPCPG